MATYFQGAVKTGTGPSEYGTDIGYSVFVKTMVLQAATAGAVDATFVLPPNCQITNITADTSVAWTATGAVNFTAGTASAGTQYVSAVDLKTAVRGAPTLTAAQVGAMANIGSNTTLVCTATTASGANNVGTTIVTVHYAPKQ